jgi:hypothetical protein
MPRGNWELVSPEWFTSELGYVKHEKGAWTAYLLRNRRTGVGWTEARPGFRTKDRAIRWIELEAED